MSELCKTFVPISGPLMGLASTLGSLAGFFVPVTVGKLTNEGVSFLKVLILVFYSSRLIQKWNAFNGPNI